MMQYTVGQQLDDLCVKFSSSSNRRASTVCSSDGSECSTKRDPSILVQPSAEFTHELYKMPSAQHQLGQICRSYIDALSVSENGTGSALSPRSRQLNGLDTKNVTVWLDVISSEFSGFNRQFIRKIYNLHRHDIQKTVFALNELEVSRRLYELQNNEHSELRDTLFSVVLSPRSDKRRRFSTFSSSTWDDDDEEENYLRNISLPSKVRSGSEYSESIPSDNSCFSGASTISRLSTT